MLSWLHDLPTYLGAALVCAAFVVPTLIGSFVLQPSVARLFRGEKDVNTILGFLLNTFALYFGVLLALLSIAVFENHNKAEDAVVHEAAGAMTLYRDLKAYPEPVRGQLAGIMHRYVDEVIGPGWALQARGKDNPAEVALMNEFHRVAAAFAPKDSAEGIRHAQTLRSLDRFVEARRARISAGGDSIPKIMWFIVLVGAVLNVIVIWMFDLRSSTHAIVGGALSLFVGLVIYMIAYLDAPFRGAAGLRPDALLAIHHQAAMDKLDRRTDR